MIMGLFAKSRSLVARRKCANGAVPAKTCASTVALRLRNPGQSERQGWRCRPLCFESPPKAWPLPFEKRRHAGELFVSGPERLIVPPVGKVKAVSLIGAFFRRIVGAADYVE